MQPDDIIRQKEWHQLTDAEREMLQHITSTPEEFNLLKNMMLSALEEKQQVPVINPSIHEFLQTQLQNNHARTRVMKPWYYAAAAVILCVLGTWLLMKKTDDSVNVAVTRAVPKMHPANVNKMPEKKISVLTVPTDSVAKKKPVVKVTVLKKKYNFEINTCLVKDSMLLALVTEVY